MTEGSITQFTYLEPIHLKIERGQRGGIGWEISIHGKNIDKMLRQIGEIEAKLIEFELHTPTVLKRPIIRGEKEE